MPLWGGARLWRQVELDVQGLEDDAGFTLIELMVVLLIIAILLAIAIPTFMGVSNAANDRAAQSDLNAVITTAKAYYLGVGNQTYANVTSAALQATEPSFTFTTSDLTSSSPSNKISWATFDVHSSGDSEGIGFAAKSASGYCWLAYDIEASPTSLVSVNGWYASPSPSEGTATQGVWYAVYNTALNSGNCDPADGKFAQTPCYTTTLPTAALYSLDGLPPASSPVPSPDCPSS